jgi:hypothetical protein
MRKVTAIRLSDKEREQARKLAIAYGLRSVSAVVREILSKEFVKHQEVRNENCGKK